MRGGVSFSAYIERNPSASLWIKPCVTLCKLFQFFYKIIAHCRDSSSSRPASGSHASSTIILLSGRVLGWSHCSLLRYSSYIISCEAYTWLMFETQGPYLPFLATCYVAFFSVLIRTSPQWAYLSNEALVTSSMPQRCVTASPFLRSITSASFSLSIPKRMAYQRHEQKNDQYYSA